MTSYFVGHPTLSAPTSQVCTASQFVEGDFNRLTGLITQTPRLHRKQWEYAYILRMLEVNDMLRAGRTGLGFGVSNEPILAVMAAHGMQLTATECAGYQPAGRPRTKLSLMDVFYGGICPEEDFRSRVAFRVVDMNQLPADLAQVDVVWACSVIEVLGSLKAGADAVVNATKLLRPGGIGIFTTHFNAQSDTGTIESPEMSAWRRLDLLDLQVRLLAEGCEMSPLNLSMGGLPEDAVIDTPPFNNPVHLKILLDGHVVTSVGFTVRKM